jgi:flagellar basal body-associated protein FliL
MKQTSTISIKRAIVLSLLMISTFIYLWFMSHGESVQAKKKFSTFPKHGLEKKVFLTRKFTTNLELTIRCLFPIEAMITEKFNFI